MIFTLLLIVAQVEDDLIRLFPSNSTIRWSHNGNSVFVGAKHSSCMIRKKKIHSYDFPSDSLHWIEFYLTLQRGKKSIFSMKIIFNFSTNHNSNSIYRLFSRIGNDRRMNIDVEKMIFLSFPMENWSITLTYFNRISICFHNIYFCFWNWKMMEIKFLLTKFCELNIWEQRRKRSMLTNKYERRFSKIFFSSEESN